MSNQLSSGPPAPLPSPARDWLLSPTRSPRVRGQGFLRVNASSLSSSVRLARRGNVVRRVEPVWVRLWIAERRARREALDREVEAGSRAAGHHGAAVRLYGVPHLARRRPG